MDNGGGSGVRVVSRDDMHNGVFKRRGGWNVIWFVRKKFEVKGGKQRGWLSYSC